MRERRRVRELGLNLMMRSEVELVSSAACLLSVASESASSESGESPSLRDSHQDVHVDYETNYIHI